MTTRLPLSRTRVPGILVLCVTLSACYDKLSLEEPYLTGSLEIDRAAALADGSDRVQVTVYVRDSDGTPQPGRKVEIPRTGPNLKIEPTEGSTTDENGVAVGFVSSSTPGRVIIRARVSTAAELVVLPDQREVIFVSQLSAMLNGIVNGDEVPMHTQASPYALVTGDVTGDGLADLVAANWGAASLSVWPGDTAGLGSPNTIAVPAWPRALAMADLDGNGLDDLAVAHSQGGATVLLAGSGGFTQATTLTTGDGPRAALLANLTSDDLPDLVVANGNSDTVSVFAGSGGTSLFAAAQSFAAGMTPSAVARGFFNEDGDADLAVANSAANKVTILVGDGSGQFAIAGSVPVAENPVDLAVADFDDDDFDDLVVLSAGSLQVLHNRPDLGSFELVESHVVGPAAGDLAAGDLNGDGFLDVAVANTGKNTVSLFLGTGGGTFEPAPDVGAAGSPVAVAIGDWNGDGWSDLAVACVDAGLVRVRYGGP